MTDIAATPDFNPMDPTAPHRAKETRAYMSVPKELAAKITDPETYSLIVTGDCLAPEINDGDQVVVCPSTQPEAGDFAIIWTKDGNCAVKRLTLAVPPESMMRATGGDVMALVMCEQINPPKQFAVSADKISAVHKVLGWVVP